ncbi:hypothetical protein ACF0H5_003164 [Mactra antiquata]
MCNVFNGYELLLFKRFNLHPEEWIEWRDKLRQREEDGTDFIGDIPRELWYLSVALHQRPRFLLHLVQDELEKEKKQYLRRIGETLLTTYINMNHFTEFHLDSIFKYGEDNKLPKEIFKCPNVRYLSLKYNCLYEIPPDIGRLQKLKHLALTNNRLHVQSIPHSLTFCSSLRTLLLDNNLLDALPGFLLQMPNIETVHRHGNHNYFKSTFMWYHTDVYCRIMPLVGSSVDILPKKPFKLSFWAAKAIIGSKMNFFVDENVAPILRDYVCDVYEQFNICQNCSSACLISEPGFKVITFKNPYLGNTCVPFQHWVCSLNCAKALEIPARMEQIRKAEHLDALYERYVHDCQQSFYVCERKRKVFSCLSGEVDDDLPESDCDTVVSLTSAQSTSTCTQSTHSTVSELTMDMQHKNKPKNCAIM